MSWLVSFIVGAILNWLASFFGKKISTEVAKEQRYQDIQKQVQDTTSELKNASTEAEREKATEDEAKNSF